MGNVRFFTHFLGVVAIAIGFSAQVSAAKPKLILPPGATLTVEVDTPTTVQCGRESFTRPRCEIKRTCKVNGYPFEVVTQSGENILSTCYAKLDHAFTTFLKLLRTGQCRTS